MDKLVRFWEQKSLAEMNQEEWESLCDGCGKCCLYKLQDEETGEYFYTNVACRFLDLVTARCGVYPDRTRLMPTCLVLTPEGAASFKWLPETCAYRLVAEGKPLPDWHPLLTGNQRSVIRSGNSVQSNVVSEIDIDMEDLEDHVIE